MMPKWMPYDGYVGPLGVGVRPIQCVEKNAEQIAERHNADIDALTAERDELQRRLDAIAKHAAAPNWGDIVCAGGKLELATTRLDEILAIAEGRDNG